MNKTYLENLLRKGPKNGTEKQGQQQFLKASTSPRNYPQKQRSTIGLLRPSAPLSTTKQIHNTFKNTPSFSTFLNSSSTTREFRLPF